MRAASTAQHVFTVTARRVTSAPLLQGHIAESDAITYTSGSRCGWLGGPRVDACSVMFQGGFEVIVLKEKRRMLT